MMKILYIAIFVLFLYSCNNNYKDTGTARGVHDCSMYEYMRSDSYNWDSTRLIIERAGLVNLFDGTDSDYYQITFFGPCNHPIRNWMYKEGYEAVSDIPVEECRELILRYVVVGRHMKDDIDFEVKGTTEGGTIFTNMLGTEVRVFRRTTDYNGVVDAGPIELHIHSLTYDATVIIASSNIQTNNGVVHSLSYTHVFPQL